MTKLCNLVFCKGSASPFRPILYKVDLNSHSATKHAQKRIEISSKSHTNLHPKWYEKNTFLTPPLGTQFVCVLYVEHVIFAFQDEPRKCATFYLNPATSALGPQMPSGNPPGVPRRAPSRGLPKASGDPSQEKSRSLPRVPRSFQKPFKKPPKTPQEAINFAKHFKFERVP